MDGRFSACSNGFSALTPPRNFLVALSADGLDIQTMQLIEYISSVNVSFLHRNGLHSIDNIIISLDFFSFLTPHSYFMSRYFLFYCLSSSFLYFYFLFLISILFLLTFDAYILHCPFLFVRMVNIFVLRYQ